MSLKPKIVEFVDVWPRLRCIAESVITLTKVERSVWNTSFRYVLATVGVLNSLERDIVIGH